MKPNFIIHLLVLIFTVFNILNFKNIDLIDWDEGVYAVQAEWFSSAGADGKPFNFQTPPLYQVIIAIFFKVFGVHDGILSVISLIFSCLTLYLLFLFARDLFSGEAALYAVVLFAVSEFFLFFSRSGLSDATFLFFFLAALYFFYKGITHDKTSSYALAGLFATFALYTKYSGPVLVCIMLALAIMNGKIKNQRLLFLAILLPSLAFLPYVFIYFKVVTFAGSVQRHAPLLGINHHRYLLYLLTYSPVILLLAVISILRKRNLERFVFVPLIVFFLILGFYHPFFRLAYPLVPFLALAAAGLIVKAKKFKTVIISCSIIVSLLLGYQTIRYRSKIPSVIGRLTNEICASENIRFVYAVTPPNIYFYINGTVRLPENHPSVALAKKMPGLLKDRMVLSRDEVLLSKGEKIAVIYSTVFDPFKDENTLLFINAKMLRATEFIDAPVYYKDIANSLREKDQVYELYLIDMQPDEEAVLKIWDIAFSPIVQVIDRGR